MNSFIFEIHTFILQLGVPYADCYVGITKDHWRRVFGEHAVRINDPTWICVDAESASTARAIETHFLKLGCDGGTGGGDDESCFVYAYRKARWTKP